MSNYFRTAPRFVLLAALLGAISLAWSFDTAAAQAPKPKKVKAAKDSTDTLPKKFKASKLFKSEAPFEMTLTGNFKKLRREKSGTTVWHPVTVAYADSAGKPVEIPLRARTRGIWRLKNCDFPPLRLNFTSKTTKGTQFDDLDEPKLVSYCRSGGNGEQWLLQEFQLYRVYALLTPISHQTRLLRVTYTDSATGKPEFTRLAFMVDDPRRMGERLGGRIFARKGAGPDDVDPAQAATMFLFQYMIGNTDFSVSGLHNAELIQMPNGEISPVAYDFDFSGAVNATYATSDPSLRIKTVRQRQFRGYCAIKTQYPAAIALFQAKKNEIYALYSDAIGALMDKGVVRETLEYFDDFYKDVKTQKDFERNLFGDCTQAS